MPKKANNQLLQLLKPIKTKLFTKKLIYTTGWITFFSLLFSSFFLVTARLIPIYYYKEIAFLFIFLAVMTAVIYSIITIPDTVMAAKEADRFGLKERIVTALEHGNSESPIAVMQREETINLLIKKLPDILENLKLWSFSKKNSLIYLSTFIIFLTLLIAPNQMDSVIAEKQQLNQNKESAISAIAKEKQKVKENNLLSAKQREELVKGLDELEKQLKNADSLTEQQKELNKINNKLEDLRKQEELGQERFNNFADSLAANQSMDKLAEALKKANSEQLKKELANLEKELASLSEAELKDLIDLLTAEAKKWDEVAKQDPASEAAQIADNLHTAANDLAAGNFANASQLLGQGLTQALQQNINSQQFTNQLAAIGSTIEQQSQLVAASDPSSGQLGQGNTNGQTAGSNNSNGNNNSGNSNGNGGDGSTGENGSGTNGSGNGSGTGNGAAGNGSGSGNGTGGGAGLGGGTHLVSVPTNRIEGDGIEDTVGGPLTGTGDETVSSSGNSAVLPGVSTPYEEVFSDYQQTAIKSIERNEIPEDYQDIVRDYFTSIEP